AGASAGPAGGADGPASPDPRRTATWVSSFWSGQGPHASPCNGSGDNTRPACGHARPMNGGGPMAWTGRRAAGSGTRETILAAARDAFAAHGFGGVTIRQIASTAAVDPALVHYYFGTKEQLFLTV